MIKEWILPIIINKRARLRQILNRPDSDKMWAMILLDNCGAHFSPQIIQTCQDAYVHLVFLPPNTTDRTQVLDFCVFGAWKNRFRNTTLPQDRQHLTTLFKRFWKAINANEGITSKEGIRRSFKKIGVSSNGVYDDTNLILHRLGLTDSNFPNWREVKRRREYVCCPTFAPPPPSVEIAPPSLPIQNSASPPPPPPPPALLCSPQPLPIFPQLLQSFSPTFSRPPIVAPNSAQFFLNFLRMHGK